MSLTLFIDKTKKTVGILKWFRDHSFNIAYPSGPLFEVDLNEFRSKATEIVKTHFEEFQNRRILEKDAAAITYPDDSKKYLRKQLPVNISKNNVTGEILISPLRFRRYSLDGLQSFEREFCKAIPINFTEGQFWNAFDEVMAELES